MNAEHLTFLPSTIIPIPVMNGQFIKTRGTLGTAPVFLTAISTIHGAIMFLRFGYAVGNVGFVGTLVIIIIGHAVTIPTAMALAEIATNQRVEGESEFYSIKKKKSSGDTMA